MMRGVYDYLLSVITASFFCSLVLAVLPKGTVRRSAVVTSAVILALVTLVPIMRIDFDDFARAIADVRMQTRAAQTGIEVQNEELVETIIRQDCESYILDKAESLGLQISAAVQICNTGSGPYPYSVRICADLTPTQRQLLSQIITDELAIPPERQVWE
ncbi:MAG: hypothetical protein MJ118_06400 [Clostridia bacterium]|nr:hypothetical protein [Clostridia bacterium]